MPAVWRSPTRLEYVMVLLVVSAITAWSVSIARDAYGNTPDISSFRQFVDPRDHRFESKAFYLYAPIFFEALGLVSLAVLLFSRPKVDASGKLEFHRVHLYGIILLFLFFLWATNEQASRALNAASLHGPPGQASTGSTHR